MRSELQMIDAQNESAKVTEIVVADGLLFVLCQSGSCTAFNRGKCSDDMSLCCSDHMSLCCSIHDNRCVCVWKTLQVAPAASHFELSLLAVSGRRQCKLNVQQKEVIRSLFFNRHLRCTPVLHLHSASHQRMQGFARSSCATAGALDVCCSCVGVSLWCQCTDPTTIAP